MSLRVSSSPRRLESVAKVTGSATYTGEGRPCAYAALVCSPCARGVIRRINYETAAKTPGVLQVLTHLNAPRLHKVKLLLPVELNNWLPLQNDTIHYAGQPVAMVIAESWEAARAAAALVEVECDAAAARLDFDFGPAEPVKSVGAGAPGLLVRGKPERSWAGSAQQVDATYRCAPAHHNPMEPAASLARWDDQGGLHLETCTQFVFGEAVLLAQAFGFAFGERTARLAAHVLGGWEIGGKVRVTAPLIGGSFGSKGANSHMLLAAMAARVVAQPVKLTLTRQQTYAMMPYRPQLQQRVRLGADIGGRLQAILHEARIGKSELGGFIEPCGELTASMYACSAFTVRHEAVTLDLNAPTFMRAPGAAPGLFALECAMDELAEKTGLDPLELRLRNYSEQDAKSGKPWSSKALRECYRRGAQQFGWARRSVPAVRHGKWLVGVGMASSAYLTQQFPCSARITLREQGNGVASLVESAFHEIGQGAWTALSQVAAECLGLPLSAVELKFGDTNLPFAAITAGSSTTLSVGSAIQTAAAALIKALLKLDREPASPLLGARPADLRLRDGRLEWRDEPERGRPVAELLRLAPNGCLTVSAQHRIPIRPNWARAAWGAQFAEVAVHAEHGTIRLQRLVGAFAGGRVVNRQLAEDQLRGGMVWGIGHALMEGSVPDLQHGGWVNDNLGEALVPTQADVGEIEVLLLEEDDSPGNPLGVKGLGEIGICGVAAAIANAVFHATGRRVRDLPLRLDSLL